MICAMRRSDETKNQTTTTSMLMKAMLETITTTTDPGPMTTRIRWCGWRLCTWKDKYEWDVCDPNTICAWLIAIFVTIIGMSMLYGACITCWCVKHDYRTEECPIQ